MCILQAGRSCFALLGVFMILWTCTPAVGRAESPDIASHLSPEERELLQEYKTNYERLKQFYNNVRIEVVWRRSKFPAFRSKDNPEGKQTSSLVYRAKEGRLFRMDAAGLDIRDESPTGHLVVRVVRPEAFVVAKRSTADKPLAIVQWSEDRDEGLGDLSSFIFQWSPYSNYVFPMETLVFEQPRFAKTYRIEKVAAHKEGAERFVTITVRAVMKRAGEEWGGSFVFYRDRAWALKDVRWGIAKPTEPQDSVRKARYEYEGARDGVPLLKRVEYWSEVGPDGKQLCDELFEVRSIEVGPLPEEEFSLAVLGLEVAAPRSNWMAVMLGVLGVTLLVVFYFILRRKERKAVG